jgi:phosphoribosylanthranilate isomerase
MASHSNIIIQIYEIQTPSEAEAMIALGVDQIGSVILSEEAWKDSLIKDTISLISASTAKSSLIPLFSRPDMIFRALDYYRPDIVHFCETLTEQVGTYENCEKFVALQGDLKKRFPEIKIMRSIPIAVHGMAALGFPIEMVRLFEPVSDYFLTDTLLASDTGYKIGSQPVDNFIGITGRQCNWDMAAEVVELSGIPVILAGGISPENVFDGILHTLPAGVDSCTGTNALDTDGRSIRFKKDADRVKQLVKEVRRAERQLENRK